MLATAGQKRGDSRALPRCLVWYAEGSPTARLLADLPHGLEPRPLDRANSDDLAEEAGVALVHLADPTASGAIEAAARAWQLPVVALVDPLADSSLPPGCYAYLPIDVPPAVLAATLQSACQHARAWRLADRTQRQLEELNAIGVQLSAAREISPLLELILTKAREITRSDAASLYLVEEGDGSPCLRFKLVQNESVTVPFAETALPIGTESVAGYVARSGEIVNLTDAYALPPGAPFRINRDFDARVGYRTKSMLVVPMKTPAGATIGVLQLINCKPRVGRLLPSIEAIEADVIPYGEQFEALAASLASQAAVALDNRRLYENLLRAYKELSEVQDQLAQAQKMEAIGRLAGGIAHDFNNLLMVILGRSEMALTELAPEASVRRDIELIQKTASRAADLSRRLLTFSRKQVREPKLVDFNAVVGGMEPMLRRLIGEDIVMTTRLAPVPGSVKADPTQLEQVLMNLVVNARDAMPGGGRLTIMTQNVVLDEIDSRRFIDARPGPHVTLTVADTGVGMDRDTQARIFEPFFTTKDPGKGTGLGLATVYGIVKQSGGFIRTDSVVGQGTTFTVHLPWVDAVAAAVESQPPPSISDRGTETILLVEDEDDVRVLARQILAARGYTVLEAVDGVGAMEVTARHPGPIQLLLTDVVMPRMNGRDLAERLAPLRPEMKVVYMSGYADQILRVDTAVDETVVLEKPVSAATLAGTVRDALDARPRPSVTHERHRLGSPSKPPHPHQRIR